MPSFSARYLSGEHEAVWNELRALGPVPESSSEDVTEVAAETMRRVRRHAERLGAAYEELGVSEGRAVQPQPGPDEHAQLDRLAAAIGGLPYALDACMRVVGNVYLMPDDAPLQWYDNREHGRRFLLPADPMMTPPVVILRHQWDGYLYDYGPDAEDDGEPPPFVLHVHGIALPSTVADPKLTGDGRARADTLVEYLRLAVAWGGLPGWSMVDAQPPDAVAKLRVAPDF